MSSAVCVIFDCNIYIDVAEALGFDASLANLRNFRTASRPLQAEIDAFQCVLAGKFGPYDLKLGSSLHIKDTVQHELSRLPEWSESSAKSFLDQFHENLVDIMLTGFIGEEHVPPLDHEDGVVFGTCHEIRNTPGIVQTILVTRDKQFADSFKDVPSHTTVLHPIGFMKLCDAAQRMLRRA